MLRLMDDAGTGSRILATTNQNSNFVLALLHRLPRGRFGHVFVDGLRDFGIPMLFGIEPAVYLIAKAAPDLTFAGREANANPLMTGPLSYEERDRRLRQYLRSIGYLKD